jgi:methylated-DNA-[protein]-cysteine S-methyltransferase
LLSCRLATPVGCLRLSAQGATLVSIDWCDAASEAEAAESPVLESTRAALQAYFESALAVPAVPLHPAGTAYQRRVWQAMADIPTGDTASYGQLAQRLGSGARAVAAACRANPYPILIPCHRVVAAHGLGGYCGASDGPWLEVKRWLLAHERGAAHV